MDDELIKQYFSDLHNFTKFVEAIFRYLYDHYDQFSAEFQRIKAIYFKIFDELNHVYWNQLKIYWIN